MQRSLIILLAGLAASAPTWAQEEDKAENARIDDLEERIAELEIDAYEDEESGGMSFSRGSMGATFQIFGDVNYTYTNPETSVGSNNSFILSSLSFVGNIRFGDHYRGLFETVISGSPNDKISFSQERLWGAWVPRDEFYAKLGTEHTAISRWNQLFHHGAWLETSTARPIMVQFEGGQGILPMHRTGLILGGSKRIEAARFEYFGGVSNGRGELPSSKQRTGDANNAKAVDLGIAVEPTWKHDWRFGVAAVIDKIPPNTASASSLRLESMKELIFTTHVETTWGRVRGLAEWAHITHEADADGSKYNSQTGYLQLEYGKNDWRPYARFGYRDMEQGDPFFGDVNRDLDRWLQTVGLRRELTANLALKIEAGYGSVDTRDSGGTVTENSLVTAILQLSFWL